jgi:predicted dinucleotide-binding enzyme
MLGPMYLSRAVLPAEAVRESSLAFLTVPAEAAVEAARAAGDWNGKILIDCTNPIRWAADGPIWDPPREGSISAALAAALPQAKLLKGFNHFGAEIHAEPRLANGPADAFFAGDDAQAKVEAQALATELGFRARDAGPLRNAAVLENLAILWIHLALKSGLGRAFALQVTGR